MNTDNNHAMVEWYSGLTDERVLSHSNMLIIANVYFIFEEKAPIDENLFTLNNVTLLLVSHA